MTVGDLLQTALNLYRENVSLFVGIVAVLTIPETIINVLIAAGSPSKLTTGNLGGYLGLTGLRSLVGLIFTIMIVGALTQAVAARYLGRPMTISGAYDSLGVSTFVTLALASILVGLVVGLGFVLLIIPGIYLAIRLVFVPQAIVLERKGVMDAFSRSWNLVEGSWWRVLGIVLVFGIVVAVVSGILGAILGAIFIGILHTGTGTTATAILSTIIGAIVTVFIQPFELAGFVMLYYDLRVRKEGFNLDHMAQQLEPPKPL